MSLRPCPFCGSTNVSSSYLYGTLCVECHDCNTHGPSFSVSRKHGLSRIWASDAAVQAWNGHARDVMDTERVLKEMRP